MLDTLCTELVEDIAVHLDGPQLSSLRFVCRAMRDKTIAVFGRAWLGLFETDLSEESMRRLETIAGHDLFRHSIHTLRIVRRLLKLDRPTCRTPLIPTLDFSSRAVVWNFQDTMRRLTNCNTIEVCDRRGRRGRYGDYDDDNGVAVGLAQTNVLCLVLSVMATNSPPIQRLYVHFTNGSGYKMAKQLPSITIDSGLLFPCLQDLDLTYHARWEEKPALDLFFNLITTASHLKRLVLLFTAGSENPEFIERLSMAPTLPPITDLKLHTWNGIVSADLARVILRLKRSLRSLHISYMTVDDWNSFFMDLSVDDFPCLERITLYHLRSRSCTRGRVYFCLLRANQSALGKCDGSWEFMLAPHRTKMRVIGVRFTGQPTGMKFALEALADDSHYVMNLRPGCPPSPGLPDMSIFASDRIGRLVPLLEQRITWDGEEFHL